MAMDSLLKLKGKKQGDIEGACGVKGREKDILVLGMEHTIQRPYDAKRVGASQRVHGPLTLIKEIDPATPMLHLAVCTGELFTDFELAFFRTVTSGDGGTENHFTIKLVDACIVSIRMWYPNTQIELSKDYPQMEEVAFSYKKIIWTWNSGGTKETEDSWDLQN